MHSKFDAFAHKVQRASMAGGIAIGILYVAGFLLNVIHYTGYGVSSFAVLRAQNILAGCWLLIPFAAVYFIGVMIAFLFNIKRTKAEPRPYGRAAFGAFLLVGTIGSLVLAPYLEAVFTSVQVSPRRIVGSVLVFGMFLAAFVSQIFTLLPPNSDPESYDTARFRQQTFTLRSAAAAWLLVCAFGYIGYFARSIYPIIPRTLGGGAPSAVDIIFREEPTTRVAFLRDGQYLLLGATDESLIVVVDGRAVEISRELVAAVMQQDTSPLRRAVPRTIEEILTD